MILDRLDHETGHIRTRHSEAEIRQVALFHPLLSGVRLVCKFRWAHHGPVEPAVFKDFLHSGRIRNDAWEAQPAGKVRWRDD
jgi:hypothetical protein